MNIDRDNFAQELPNVLASIAKSSVVAIDCEFSGTRPVSPGHAFLRSGQAGEDKMAEAWTRLRDAAERYTIVQLGITCVWPDTGPNDDPIFRTETYSFVVSPFPANTCYQSKKLGRLCDRDVTLNGSTTRFLLENGFDGSRIFWNGIPYLSLREEKRVAVFIRERERELSRLDCSGGEKDDASTDAVTVSLDGGAVQEGKAGRRSQTISSVSSIISLDSDDGQEEDRECDNRPRGDIDDDVIDFSESHTGLGLADYVAEWLASKHTSQGWEKKIFPPGDLTTRTWADKVITHLRTNLPPRVCHAYKDPEGFGVVVKPFDAGRECNRIEQEIEDLRSRVNRARGLGYVVSALSSSTRNSRTSVKEFLLASDIDTSQPARAISHLQPPAEPSSTLSESSVSAWDRAPPSPNEPQPSKEKWIKDVLDYVDLLDNKAQKPILLGHNLAWDLAFLQATFNSPPPETYDDFLLEVKQLSEQIIDTKILAMDYNPDFQDFDLQSIVGLLEKYSPAQPKIECEAGAEMRGVKAHDAGYDSWLTAKAFIRLGQTLVEKRYKDMGMSMPRDQAVVNMEVSTWASEIWARFRNKFVMFGNIADIKNPTS